MLLPDRRARSNRLIEALSGASKRRILGIAEPVALEPRRTLVARGGRFTHVYFPTAGFISMTLPADRGRLEVGSVGREGFYGIGAALGAGTSEFEAIVQGEGSAWRVGVPDFRALLRSDRTVRRQVDLYTYVMLGQVARSARCNRFHQVEQRVARWLLANADRAQSATFDVTHARLAEMLGVRRVGVTTAASALHYAGLITSARGTLAIRDREGLRRAACACYREEQDTYRRQLEEDALP